MTNPTIPRINPPTTPTFPAPAGLEEVAAGAEVLPEAVVDAAELEVVAVLVMFAQVMLEGTVKLVKRIKSAHCRSTPSPPLKTTLWNLWRKG